MHPAAMDDPMSILQRLFVALILSAGLAACVSVSPGPRIVNSAVFVSEAGGAIRADYRDDDTVTLSFPDGGTRRLPAAVSASGARYAADGREWWEHQGEARYSVDERTVFVGRRQP